MQGTPSFSKHSTTSPPQVTVAPTGVMDMKRVDRLSSRSIPVQSVTTRASSAMENMPWTKTSSSPAFFAKSITIWTGL